MKLMSITFILLTITLGACNKQPEEAKKEHLWQQQTDTLKEAKKVQQQMNESAEQMKKRMDELQKE